MSLPDDDPVYTLKKVMEKIDFSGFLVRYNGYGEKYALGNIRMFIIEDMDKVRAVIEKNRRRNLTKHKKLSNNSIIEIDNCSPLELLKLQIYHPTYEIL